MPTDEAGQQLAGVDAEQPRVSLDAEQLAELRVERQAELEPRPQDAEVAEEDRQHQPRHGPEEPGVQPTPRRDRIGFADSRMIATTTPSADADDHREDGEQDRARAARS